MTVGKDRGPPPDFTPNGAELVQAVVRKHSGE